MSAEALARAFAWRGLEPGPHLLLVWIANQADAEGVAGLYRALSRARIAEAMGCSLDAIDRRIRALETAGALSVERRQRGVEGRVVHLPSVYRVCIMDPSRADAATPSRADAATPSRADAATPSRADAATPSIAACPESGAYKLRTGPRAGISQLNTLCSEGRDYSDRSEPSISSSRGARESASGTAPADEAAAWRATMARLLSAVDHPLLDPAKMPGLVLTEDWVRRWLRQGADLDADVIPAVRAVLDRRGGRGDPISNWKFFDGAVREKTALRLAADAAAPITAADLAAGKEGSNGHHGRSDTHAGGAGAGAGRFGVDTGAERARMRRAGLSVLQELGGVGVVEG